MSTFPPSPHQFFTEHTNSFEIFENERTTHGKAPKNTIFLGNFSVLQQLPNTKWSNAIRVERVVNLTATFANEYFSFTF